MKLVICLQRLDLSENNFGSAGTAALASFLAPQRITDADMTEKVLEMSLKELLLTNCQLETETLFKVLKESALCESLSVLDVSKNKINKIAADYFVQFIQSSTAIHDLRLNNCSLMDKICVQLLTAISENSKLFDISIDLSQNELKAAGASAIAPILRQIKNLFALNLRDNG